MYSKLILGLVIGIAVGWSLITNWPPFTSTRSAMPTPTPDSTDIAEILAVDIEHNADWLPIVQEFDGVEMVLVPAGCFLMGNEDGIGNETPVHEQCLNEPIWLDRYEVTNAQFGGANYWPDPDFPYAGASWFDANAHCQARGARLPNEIEWEYAARGIDNWRYPWGNELVDDYVTHSDNSVNPVAVTSHPDGTSWVGAYNMSGNLTEWTSSVYLAYPYDADLQTELSHTMEVDEDAPEEDHSEHDEDVLYTVRGGSFSEAKLLYITTFGRYGLHADEDLPLLGFRCARDVEAK